MGQMEEREREELWLKESEAREKRQMDDRDKFREKAQQWLAKCHSWFHFAFAFAGVVSGEGLMEECKDASAAQIARIQPVPLIPFVSLQELVHSLPMDEKVVRKYKRLHAAMASADYFAELRKILEKKVHVDYVWIVYAAFPRKEGTRGAPDKYERLLLRDGPSLNELAFLKITLFATLTVAASELVLRKHAVIDRPDLIAASKIYSEISSAATSFFMSLVVLMEHFTKFYSRFRLGMARREQIGLLGLVCEQFVGDIRFLLYHCGQLAYNEIDRHSILQFLERHRRLLRFLLDLRSESIETRIWRHLREAEEEPMLVVIPWEPEDFGYHERKRARTPMTFVYRK
ncbi:hypothetical protein BJ508DRAFT_180889 [Ascobolus immersus RN42]|uniref:Uncharacterized protein n=1 Tax=Ascobolus immersus RN42 TaxID=1160509 RepID=A0A3N4HSI2_ASCIM|nr:hypothetical protein BJ508DRAFT_180889 [Ascobolus immersus RN42]